MSPSGRLSDGSIPSDAARLLAEAVESGRQGDTEAAEKGLRAFLERYPEHSDANCELGKLLYQADRIDEAREFFQAAVDRDPAHLLGLYYLGRTSL